MYRGNKVLVGSKFQQSYWFLDADCGYILVLCANLLRAESNHSFINPALCITLLPQLQILEQYWEGWKRYMPTSEKFKFPVLSKHKVWGKLSNVKGQEWKATLVGSEVS